MYNGEEIWARHVNTQLAGLDFAAGMAIGAIALVAVVWTVYWKYRAIWHAVKHENRVWVVIFLLVNTLGILEILYLFWLSKYHRTQQ